MKRIMKKNFFSSSITTLRYPNRIILACGIAAFICLNTNMASATTGVMKLTSNKTLTEDHYGQIQLNANNITLNCNNHAIRVPSSSGDRPTNCNNHNCGIRLIGKNNVTIKNCRILGGWYYGSYLKNADDARIESTAAVSSTKNFCIRSSDDVELRYVDSELSSSIGISVYDSSNIYLFHTDAIDSGSHGIYLKDSPYAYFQYTDALGNENNGLYCRGSDDADFHYNAYNYNDDSGAYIRNCDNITLNNVEYHDNDANGLRMTSSTGGAINYNDGRYSGSYNLARDSASDSGNTWSGNDWHGSTCTITSSQDCL